MSRVSTGASTLGRIAREYSICVRTLNDLISAYPELRQKVEAHTGKNKMKALKILPPKIVDEIFSVLGDP